MKSISKKNLVTFGATAAGMLVPFVASAQNEINSGLSRLRILFPSVAFNSISGFIYFIIQILLYIAGGVSVLFIIIGGFQYILSAGNAESATKGKKTVVNAIIGLVLIILSYIIINVIVNTILGYNSLI